MCLFSFYVFSKHVYVLISISISITNANGNRHSDGELLTVRSSNFNLHWLQYQHF